MPCKISKFIFCVTLLALNSGKALAFPDTIRHGYVNCTACHASPSGGGLLNAYGRSLSRELLSTWGYKNEEQPLHGLAPIPAYVQEHIFVGGDARYVKRAETSEGKTTSEGFLMQARLRAGAAVKNFKVLAAVGKIDNPRAKTRIRFVSPEYYGLWMPKEEIHFRIGRFNPIFGLRMPDHNLWVKSELSFVPWMERGSSELIYEGESQFLSMAGFQSTSATPIRQQTTGYTGSIYQILGEKNRVGISGLNAEGQGSRLRSLSLHATLSFSDSIYSMTELTRVWNLGSLKDVGFSRLGYEVYKGITPYLQGQFKVDRLDSSGSQYKFGGGFIWMPRPHFEINGAIETLRGNSDGSTEKYLLIHYYL